MNSVQKILLKFLRVYGPSRRFSGISIKIRFFVVVKIQMDKASCDLNVLFNIDVTGSRRGGGSTPGAGEVRCYCNQPECVPQGYMCRGKGCFTELPLGSNSPSFLRPEHSANNGCLEESFKEKQCPPGFLCCEQDLCNHVDSPAMISRLNKTLQGKETKI